jgi:ADP-ribose pyrophosphatase
MNREQPQLKRIEQVSDGWLKKYILTYDLPDGSEKTYETISRKNPADLEREFTRGPQVPPHVDAVSIIATTDDDEILLIKEFRYPLNAWCVAFPAGLVDGDESVQSAVNRELREETGYAVKRHEDGTPMMRELPQPSYSSNGMTEECLHIVRAQVERVGDAQPEPSEFIEVFPLKIADIPQFLEENQLAIGSRAQLVLESYGTRIGPGSEAAL